MAELELKVKYDTLPSRAGFYMMAALFPVWALLVPFLLGLVIAFLLRDPASITNPQITLSILLGLAAVPVLGVLLTALFEDNRLYISKSGIAFPIFMLPLLGFRRQRSWAELRGAGIRRRLSGSQKEPDLLYLNFHKTMPLSFKLRSLDKVQLEQMLLAMELWTDSQTRNPDLVDFQNQLHNENKGLGHLSQIEMWEEELARRFSATSFVPLEPGRQLLGGSIEIVRQLAFGGLSAIYLAQQNKTNMLVLKEAVVPVNSDPETRKKAKEHFLREAGFLMSLEHPRITKVLGHFSEEGRDYMLMQYIKGQDLRQLVKQQGAQPQLKVLDWALDIVEILKYLHAQDPPVVHRDLSPDNLVLSKDDELILIDFGAANEFVGTATGTLVGKQSYISPEQLRGKASQASDIYSFGATMHFLLCGEDPIPLAESHPALINQSVHIKFDELVAAMTKFETAERLVNLDEIGSGLKEIRNVIIKEASREESGRALRGGAS